ncbi:bacillithiol biosynthesis cysteine-adding enzyme BshC [Catalinimonas alkaloidigena]|uniref:Putative cysteine ligase BshC n=1 Tax=Catalinimonas alkaloidigena TaxID=1075417 RepID=A0A1G9JFC4_9BACT|nr:bacillithiol biosynthesis cysteine-adding enzyme BshC [Catalinimonas alkaloidigena]SDL35843.1 bacillithiol biosynthesis cysteine-adding enzyme BshC [Catalinimonas alkaloidigena]
MLSHRVPLAQTPFFSSLFQDYITRKESVAPFYQHYPAPEHFEQIIRAKAASFPTEQRERLAEVWKEQYASVYMHPQAAENLNALTDERTFTVTTGHQLNIFSGPLYFMYKIVTTINTARELARRYPDYRFVPVYWMATEDHDFEEINHFTLFGKRYEWQTDQQGAVGRFQPNGLTEVVAQLAEHVPLFERAYADHPTLAAATRYFVNELFGKEGLLVLDADHATLKQTLRPVVEADLFDHVTLQESEKTNRQLEEAGYKQQIYVREINFFYLDDQRRERIEQKDDRFYVLNTDLSFSADELRQLLADHPERFSPNVALRPLYQELILPNLAYIGGPAEVAYWLQLKGIFDHFDVPFPAVMPRNFALVVNKPNQRRVDKLGLPPALLLQPEEDIKAWYMEETLGQRVELNEESTQMAALFEAIRQKAVAIDPTLEGFVGAEARKAEKVLETIGKRVRKAEEKQEETALQQITTLKDKLFPEGNLQERTENFLSFYLNDSAFLHQLLETLEPFDFSFFILTDHA